MKNKKNHKFAIIKKYPFSENFARVIVQRKISNDGNFINLKEGENYLTLNGDLLFQDECYRKCLDFSEGIGTILKTKYSANYVDSDGNFIFSKDFDFIDADRFHCGWSLAKKVNKKKNFIDKNGNFISKNDFFNAMSFKEGFAAASFDKNDWNYIDCEGKPLTNHNFFRADSFSHGYGAVLTKSGEFNYVNKSGEFLLKNARAINGRSFKNGMAAVRFSDREWKFIDVNGNLIGENLRIINCSDFCGDYAIIETSKGQNFINKKGELLSKTWFKKCYEFSGKFALVLMKNDLYNYVSKDGVFLSDKGFRWASNWRKKGYGEISFVEGEKNFINERNEIFKNLTDLLDAEIFRKTLINMLS